MPSASHWPAVRAASCQPAVVGCDGEADGPGSRVTLSGGPFLALVATAAVLGVIGAALWLPRT
ncbi:MAG: hypothetical protein ACR2JN_13255, partial [Lapillicoccus sp.]